MASLLHQQHQQLYYDPYQQPQSSSLPISLLPSQDDDLHSASPASQPPSLHDEQSQSQDSSMSALHAFTAEGGRAAGLSRPLTLQEHERLTNLERLKLFLATAPSAWSSAQTPPTLSHSALNRFLLPNQEYVTCVLWGGLYHITGTDIVRALVFRFEAFGRPVRNMKKFEEGIFSDLRNLKPGVDACLEEPKSHFLDLLFKYQCIRTQKKQKVFYWFSVPHDRLFLDALERDLKREKMGLEPTTVVAGEPAQSFTYDPKRTLFEQFSKPSASSPSLTAESDDAASSSDAEVSAKPLDEVTDGPSKDKSGSGPNQAFLSMFSLFEGSPSYKTRRRRQPKTRRSSPDSAPGMPYPHPSYRTIDEHQIRPSVAHELGLGLSAGDLFLAQANASSSRYAPPLDTAPIVERAPPPLAAFRTEPVRHHSYPLYTPATSASAHAAATFAEQQRAQQAPRTVKAYTCPLFSCGRLFKRMEHLKRHIRTHTLERPYPCDRCAKRFARADNLQQHIRIHERADVMGQSSTDDDDAELADLGAVLEVEVRGDLPEEGLTPPIGLASSQPSDGSFFSYNPAPALAASASWPSSAPSQQTAFDHSALFATALELDSHGPGPIRRHRSATPAGGDIRRPASSYHPYAPHGAAPTSASARSSPAGYTVTLDSFSQQTTPAAASYPRAAEYADYSSVNAVPTSMGSSLEYGHPYSQTYYQAGASQTYYTEAPIVM